MPVNMGNNHWVLAQIKFSITTPANVEIAWFDSLVDSTDPSLVDSTDPDRHLAKFKQQGEVLKAWLTKKYNERTTRSFKGGAASGGAAAGPLEIQTIT
jgi:hypothetical protein